ncbi:MAG: hypothetical protein ACREDR_09280, partial [Blastocatellia bacterium]
TAGHWTNSYYRETMEKVAPRFHLTKPPDLPDNDDKFAVAAIHDRFQKMSDVLFNVNPITINRLTSGSTNWAPGPGPRVNLGPDFFGIPAGSGRPLAQLRLLLRKIVEATPGISSRVQDDYVELANEIRIHQGGGAP